MPPPPNLPDDPAEWDLLDYAISLRFLLEQTTDDFEKRWGEAVKARARRGHSCWPRWWWSGTRRGHGVSLKALARELEVQPATISRWEGGTRTPEGEPGSRYRELLKGWEAEWVRYAEAWLLAFQDWVDAGASEDFDTYLEGHPSHAVVSAYLNRDPDRLALVK